MQFMRRYYVPILLFFMFCGALLFSMLNAPELILDAQQPKVLISDTGAKTTSIEANKSGHFTFLGTINDIEVKFFYDTGATDVVIPVAVANYLKLEEGERLSIKTANGTAFGFDTSLDKVSIGHIEINNVDAIITSNMEGDEILLGMSFLKHVDIRHAEGKLLLARME